MKVFYAQIVGEPENAPTLLLAKTEDELLVKIKAELSWLDGINDCADLDEAYELYDEHCQDKGNSYGGLFTGEQDL